MRIVRHLTTSGPAWAALQPDGSALALEGTPATSLRPTDRVVPLGKRLAPIEPANLIGIGLNYRQHAAEGGKPVPARPMWFMKTVNSIQNPGDPIAIPPDSHRVDYEGELAVVLGRPARDVAAADALSYVLGYTVANDVSARGNGATAAQLQAARDPQRKAQWRVDLIAAENSMGFHAPQEAARILGEAIDYARQGQIELMKATQ